MQLYFGHAQRSERLQQLDVGGQQSRQHDLQRILQLGEAQQRHRTQHDGHGAVAEQGLGAADLFQIVNKGRCRFHTLRNLRHKIVVVGVEPLGHFQGGHVLDAPRHGKIAGQSGQAPEAVRDQIEAHGPIEHVIVERRIADADVVDAGVLLRMPALLRDLTVDAQQLLAVNVAFPVGRKRALDSSVFPDARIAQRLSFDGHLFSSPFAIGDFRFWINSMRSLCRHGQQPNASIYLS